MSIKGHFLKKIKQKSGVAIVQIVFFSVLLFPVVLGGLMDATGIYNLNKNMKNALDMATKSGSSRLDLTSVALGNVYIDKPSAIAQAKIIFAKNMALDQITLANVGNPNIVDGSVKFIVQVDEAYYGVAKVYPPTGTLTSVTSANVQVSITKPTVFCIAKAEYTTMFGKKYAITRWSASSLNGN